MKQETQAQCVAGQALDKELFSSPPFPRPQVCVTLSPAHDQRQLSCVLLHSPGAQGGIILEAAPPGRQGRAATLPPHPMSLGAHAQLLLGTRSALPALAAWRPL